MTTRKPDRAALAADRARKKALLASATAEGVRGLYDELAILCADCKRPMLVLVPEAQRQAHGAFYCPTCGARRFMARKS